jgi:hypothetical protein
MDHCADGPQLFSGRQSGYVKQVWFEKGDEFTLLKNLKKRNPVDSG